MRCKYSSGSVHEDTLLVCIGIWISFCSVYLFVELFVVALCFCKAHSYALESPSVQVLMHYSININLNAYLRVFGCARTWSHCVANAFGCLDSGATLFCKWVWQVCCGIIFIYAHESRMKINLNFYASKSQQLELTDCSLHSKNITIFSRLIFQRFDRAVLQTVWELFEIFSGG